MASDTNSDSCGLVGNNLLVGTDEGIADDVVTVATAFETVIVQIQELEGNDAPDAKDRQSDCMRPCHSIVEVQYSVAHEVELDTW